MMNPTQEHPSELATPVVRSAAVDEVDGAEELASDVRQYVTFIAGDEVFAVEMAPVQEIVRVPDVVRVPLGPRTLEGLANLRGKVLPIVSLRSVFGFPPKANDDASRALVIELGQPLGFVVDRVVSVIGIEPSKLEGVDGIQGAVNTQLLSGIIKGVAGHPMIMVLDFAKLIAQEYEGMRALSGDRSPADRSSESAPESEGDDTANDELQLVSFDVAEQEYAIAIEDVQEIVQIPETIVRVPHSESHVLGVMTLRNRLLPLVSLRRMFALPPRDPDAQSRIVVVSVGAASVGIVMDSVNQVLRVALADVDEMPGLFSREGELADISKICRLDGGKRLVSIISAANLFRHSAIKEALTTMGTTNDKRTSSATNNEEADADDDEQVVVFRLEKEEFGVPIDSVQEIVRVPEELTHVPRSPSFVEGVINLRGAVLPVIDLRRRLGLPAAARSDRQRVVVFLINAIRTGFIVDSVAEVLKIARSAIEPSPQLSREQGKLLARMANLEKQKRMVQLIDPSHLMDSAELHDLAALAA